MWTIDAIINSPVNVAYLVNDNDCRRPQSSIITPGIAEAIDKVRFFVVRATVTLNILDDLAIGGSRWVTHADTRELFPIDEAFETEAVKSLMKACSENPSALPALADALEEAGFENAEALDSLRKNS